MNIRKGVFRLTLVLSILCGISTFLFSDNISKYTGHIRLSRDIKITIPLPSDWENKTLQQKMNSEVGFLIACTERSEILKASGICPTMM